MPCRNDKNRYFKYKEESYDSDHARKRWQNYWLAGLNYRLYPILLLNSVCVRGILMTGKIFRQIKSRFDPELYGWSGHFAGRS